MIGNGSEQSLGAIGKMCLRLDLVDQSVIEWGASYVGLILQL